MFDKRIGLSHNRHKADTKYNDQPSDSTSVTIRKAIFNSTIIPSKDTEFPGYLSINSKNWSELAFTTDECNKIINLITDSYPHVSSIGGTKDSSKVDMSVRSAEIYSLENDEENRWIYEKVSNAVAVANSLHFDYSITGILHPIQLIHYKSDFEIPGHYDWHVDSGRGEPATRKISFTAQLSNPADYEGCELIINNHGNILEATKEQGSIHMFPSYQVHKVSPITRGNRFALVIWIHGSGRFR
jgi:PKHD-type hydroxylase